MFSTAKDDDMIECPYNNSHYMTRKRLIPHLIKCRLSYPDVELVKCPFNASHLVPEPEFSHHVNNCKDKAIIHQYKYNNPPVKVDIEDRKQVHVDCDENWDDTDVTDYDSKKHAATANVIRNNIGNLKSVRKEFRKSERKRLGDHDSDSDDDDAVSNIPKKVDSYDDYVRFSRKRGYQDFDSKKRQENREHKWFEDLGPSSSSRSSYQPRDDYADSLREYSKQKRYRTKK